MIFWTYKVTLPDFYEPVCLRLTYVIFAVPDSCDYYRFFLEMP